jgi:hypothetical protein
VRGTEQAHLLESTPAVMLESLVENFPWVGEIPPTSSCIKLPQTAALPRLRQTSIRHGMCLHADVRTSGEATMLSGQWPVSEWLQRIRAEYQEMPGLSLNKQQMQKMWGLKAFVCDALVDALVAARVLRRTSGGSYVLHGARV